MSGFSCFRIIVYVTMIMIGGPTVLTLIVALLWPTVDALSNSICTRIEKAISNDSDVYYSGSANYTRDISHWSLASIQPSICTVEPGSVKDVGVILRLLGDTRTPFAVKSGGHATNPGFSDTPGVLVAMCRFSRIDYDPVAQTVTIGVGLIWDQIYSALLPYGVNVVGGRVSGIGAAGFVLGGGYSWLTNQHGLALDNVVAMELVKPNGIVSHITSSSDPDLFFALKGTQNNFGIVTKLVLKTYPQGLVWGGLKLFLSDQIEALNAATVDFAHNVTDPKAAIIMSYTWLGGQVFPGLLMFYDGPTPPENVFDAFMDIPSIQDNTATKTFPEVVAAFPTAAVGASRSFYAHIPILDYSLPVVEAMVNETFFWSARLSEVDPNAQIGYVIEPFLSNIYSHNTKKTAYPPDRHLVVFPSNIANSWTSATSDTIFLDAMRQSTRQVQSVAAADGQIGVFDAPMYPNYALFDIPPENIFGDNLGRLRNIKARVDPHDIMGLAGGFKL